jgi:hypothetical protein
MALTAPDVHVYDTELDTDYYVSEARFRNPPKKGLWKRLDSDKPKTSVASAAAKKQATSGHEADSKKETA